MLPNQIQTPYARTAIQTSSSAVEERPRDALCPSLVSLNKIITRADSFIIVTWASHLPLRNVAFGVTLRLLVIHFVVVSHHQQSRPLTSDYSVINSPWSVAAKCIAPRSTLSCVAPAVGTLHSTQWSHILAQNRDFCLPTTPAFDAPVRGFPSEYCHAVWYGKPRMAWLADGGKILQIRLIVLTECANVTYTHRHRMTA